MLKKCFNQSKHCKPDTNTCVHLKSSSGCGSAPRPSGLGGRHSLSAASLCCMAGTAEVTTEVPGPWCASCWLAVRGDSRLLPPACGCWAEPHSERAQANPRCGSSGGDWWVRVSGQMLVWGAAEAAEGRGSWTRGWEVALGMLSVTGRECGWWTLGKEELRYAFAGCSAWHKGEHFR